MRNRFTWLMLGLTSLASARTLTVGVGAQFPDIRSAVAASAAGDAIEVQAGNYYENIVLNTSVELVGIGRPVLHGSGEGSVITVLAPGCVIRGFRIEHSGPMLVHEDSGVLLKSGGNRVEDNELRDVLFGIYLFQSSHNRVVGNVIEGRKELGYGERGAGIHVFNANDNIIDRNRIRMMRDGMYLQNLDRSVIRGNRISDLRYGLHYMYSNDNVFEDNVFENNIAGAAIMYSQNIEFRRNSFLHNRGFSSFGMLFQDSHHCVAEENLFVDNAVGIFMEALTDSRLERNLIEANDVAIEVFSSSERNVVTRNNVISNLSPIRIIGKKSNIQWDSNGTGNYWSNYTGYDLDGDGIGDVSLQIQNLFERIEGNRPRLRLFFDSPAAQALAAAELAFPIIPAAPEFDRYPLMKPVAFDSRASNARVRRASSAMLAGIPLSLLAAVVFLIRKGTTR